MHRVHAPGAHSSSATLSADEAHHVTRVLRLGAGDEVIVFDGGGREWLGRVASLSRTSVVVDLVDEREPIEEPSVFVTVGLGLLKGGQMDDVVRDVTTLGAGAIAPFVSSHVALPEEARQTRSIERWQRVAIASVKQSGRAVVPAIRPVATFERLLNDHHAELIVLCVEPRLEHARDVLDMPPPERALVLVGPEGGWAASEVELAQRAGARMLGLGPWTLRAEVAPVVALSALWTRWRGEGQRAEGKGQR